MAYDQASFLAGVAVGRNLKSYPTLMRNRAESIFAFTVRSSTAPWEHRVYGYFQGEIIWGDGTSDEFPGDMRTRIDVTHEYQAAGEFRVLMLGVFQVFDFYVSNAANLISVDTPYPIYTGIDSIGQGAGYISLPTIVAAPNLERVADGLFKNYIYPGVFVFASSTFVNCPKLERIPADMLYGIQNWGFPNPTSRAELRNICSNCPSLTTIPRDMFSNPSLSQIKDFFSIFYMDTGITSIPHGLLDKMTGLERVSGAFRGMGLTDIPADLFDHCPNITGFQYTFAENTGITGNLPDLWNQYPNADGTGCFRGCTNAANYGSVPNAWK